MNYRGDIDGLRALAVLSVIGYHFQIPGFSFGFAGVDLFFVISGYLITYIILQDHEKDQFSYTDFLVRRAKRLLPAFATMAIAVLLMCGLLTSQYATVIAGQEAAAAALFASNFYFAADVGYFARASEERVFLHTWSLAVEEQFYLIWPWLALLFTKLCRTKVARTILIAISVFLAFCLAEWLARTSPESAFYWPHARAWELGVGALVASLHLSGRRTGIPGPIAMAFAMIAFGVSIFWLGPETRVPGYELLPIILCGALVLEAGHNSPKAWWAWPLDNLFMRFIGRISYSLYLWHWPFLVLFIASQGRTPEFAETFLLIAASFIVSVVSWAVIEQPIRKTKLRPNQALPGAAIVIASIVGISLCAGIILETLKPRTQFVQQASTYVEEKNPLRANCHLGKDSQPYNPVLCQFGNWDSSPPSVLIVGDSHADHWVPGISAILKRRKISGQQLTASSCLPMFGIYQVANNTMLTHCELFQDTFRSIIESENKPEVIVLAARWSVYFETVQFLQSNSAPVYASLSPETPFTVEGTQKAIKIRLEETVNELTKRGHKVIILGQVPEYGTAQFECVIGNQGQQEGCGPKLDVLLNRMSGSNQMLRRVVENTDAELILPTDEICDSKGCPLIIDGVYLYRDDDHLNVKGSEIISNRILRRVTFSDRRQ